MKKLIVLVAAALAATSVLAGEPCSRFEGAGLRSCGTASQFPGGDPVPSKTDDGLGGGGSDGASK